MHPKIAKFEEMCSNEPIQIAFPLPRNLAFPLHRMLENQFFEHLEQKEILGGRIELNLDLQSKSSGIYVADIQLKGQVEVLCDRCLESLSLPVEAAESIKTIDDGAFAEYADSETDDDLAMHVDAKTGKLDLDWTIYEIIETSLPLQRVHPEGECNEDMTGRFITETE